MTQINKRKICDSNHQSGCNLISWWYICNQLRKRRKNAQRMSPFYRLQGTEKSSNIQLI